MPSSARALRMLRKEGSRVPTYLPTTYLGTSAQALNK